MTTEPIDLFGSALAEIADGPKLTGHMALTEGLMRRLAEKGLTLARLADRRMMKRSLRTLEAHARKFEIAFPDYVPMALRRKVTFVRMGDFYECIGSDAEVVAAKLGIVVTRRCGSKEPMCGVPCHVFEDCKSILEPAFIVKIAKQAKAKAVAHA